MATQRQLRNIQFKNCQFRNNQSDGLIVDPGPGFQFDNLSLIDCLFANPGWGINFAPEGDTKPEVTGCVTNARIVGCFFQQGVLAPSCVISIGGSGTILGCDFVSHDELEKPAASQPQISFNALWSPATWRVIGNHFKASPKNDYPAIDLAGSNVQTVIIGNHYEAVQESAFTYPPGDPQAGQPRPLLRFVWCHEGSDPAAHVIHSNIGPGQIYSLEANGEFRWIDLSPGVPLTLGSPATKGRDVATEVGSTMLNINLGDSLNYRKCE